MLIRWRIKNYSVLFILSVVSFSAAHSDNEAKENKNTTIQESLHKIIRGAESRLNSYNGNRYLNTNYNAANRYNNANRYSPGHSINSQPRYRPTANGIGPSITDNPYINNNVSLFISTNPNSSNSKPSVHKDHAADNPNSKNASLSFPHSEHNISTEGKILLDGEDSTDQGKGICLICPCSLDLKMIACLHSHNEDRGVHNIILEKDLIPGFAETIHVIGYDSVHIRPGSFSDPGSKVTKIIFQNIKNIALEKNSFLFAEKAKDIQKVEIRFENCIIPRLPEEFFTQNIGARHGRILRQKDTRYLSLYFNRSKIDLIEKKAISNARIIELSISNSEIKRIETKSIDANVYELTRFKNNDLPSLPTEALCIHSKTTVFNGNRMGGISNRSIQIETENQVLFEHNTIDIMRSEGLMGIQPVKGKYGTSIVFANNMVVEAEPRSLLLDLSFSHHEHNILNNSFQVNCDCNISSTFQSITGTNEQNDSTFPIIRSSQCYDPSTDRYAIIENFLGEECSPFPILTVSVIGAAIIILIIAIVICTICSIRIQRIKEESNMLGDCASHSFSTLNKNYAEALRDPLNYENLTSRPYAVLPWGLAVPEVRTYQQNEVPEFNERTESICATSRSAHRTH